MQVEISFERITNVNIKSKVDNGEIISTVSFETKPQPATVARLLALQKQGRPIEAILWSPQALFDLVCSESKVEEPVLQVTPGEK